MKQLLIICLFLGDISPVEAVNWQRHSIGSIEYPVYLLVNDLDEDGDLDVAAGSKMDMVPVDSEVAWFENNLATSGTFVKRIISPATPPSEAIQNAEALTTADIDKDGQKDIAVAAGRMSAQYGGFYWFKSPEGFQGDWIRYTIYEPEAGNSFFKVYPIDANEDGWSDLIIGGDAGAYLFLILQIQQNPQQHGNGFFLMNTLVPLLTWQMLTWMARWIF